MDALPNITNGLYWSSNLYDSVFITEPNALTPRPPLLLPKQLTLLFAKK